MKTKLMELGKLIDIKDDINLEQQAIQCDALKKVPFFASDETMHDFVAELAMNASSYWYRPGRVIIQEGDTKCDEMYVLLRGAVEVTACGEFLGRLENDLFGEICVLDLLERRTANVIAATQCHCMVFTRQLVIPVLAKYPDARMRLLEHARQRLVALNDAIGTDKDSVTRGGTGVLRLAGCAVGFGSVIQSADAHLFAANPIFQDARVDFLYELSCKMTNKKYEEGKTIIEEGSIFKADRDSVYWVAKGQVEVWKGGHFVTLLGEGQVFGELAAFRRSGSKRQATVKSKTRVILRMVRAAALVELLQSFEDDALMAKWEADMAHRAEQLAQKEQLHTQMQHKSTDIDFMFMKVPEIDGEGKTLPKNEQLDVALRSLDLKGLGTDIPRPPMMISLPGMVA